MALVKKQHDEDDQIIKPEAVTPALDTSSWPLLLKNWDQRMKLTRRDFVVDSILIEYLQSSSAPATSPPSPPAARLSVATLKPTYPPASSTSTNPRTLLPTKSSPG